MQTGCKTVSDRKFQTGRLSQGDAHAHTDVHREVECYEGSFAAELRPVFFVNTDVCADTMAPQAHANHSGCYLLHHKCLHPIYQSSSQALTENYMG